MNTDYINQRDEVIPMERLRLAGMSLMLALCFSAPASFAETVTEGSQETRPEKCNTPLHISEVDSDKLLAAIHYITDCITPEEKLDVYVSGPGGSVSVAQAFYDQIRTHGLNKHLRFKSYGIIASSSNIIWLSADERIVTPGSMFLLHKATIRLEDEDPELGVSFKDIQTKATVASVRIAAGDRAARIWEECFNGKVVATAFDGKEAVRNGWATSMEAYK